MKIIKGGVTKPRGFTASGLCCGIKRSGKPDLALIFSTRPAVAAGVFTKNSIKAAPVVVSKEKLKNNEAQAIVANSGNANCYTGSFGLLYAKRTAEHVAEKLGIAKNNVLVASTGIIGKPLPYQRIKTAIPALVKGLSAGGGTKAARAIMTTDTKPKEIAVTLTLGGKKVTIGAIAKGSGMIAPNMATMLGFITTDAAISKPMLHKALKEAVAVSFNSITVDGCMSTNDMVVVLANGAAGNKTVTKPGKDFKRFTVALRAVCLDLAKKIVLDAEGGTKFIEITVCEAKSTAQARAACFAIANSNLVKTAAFGNNPNWGRIAAAVGSLGLAVDEKQLRIKFGSFAKKHIHICVELNLGAAAATVFTSDLSLEYVRINGKYS